MSAGRNSPCPCNSGKKFKACCLGKRPPVGACTVLLPPEYKTTCGATGIGGLSCTYCGASVVHCAQHHGQAVAQMRGHALRAHPEKVPGIVDKVRRDPRALQNLREEFARDPEAWRATVETLWPT